MSDKQELLLHKKELELKNKELDHANSLLNLDRSLEWEIDVDNRIIKINEEVTQLLVERLDSTLTHLEKKSKKAITIKLSTEGGEIYAANSIIARIKESPCQIIIKGHGRIMSAGLQILASGDKRLLSKYATIMHHEASYETGYNKHLDQKNIVKQVEIEESMRYEILEELTGTDRAIWKAMAQGPDFFIKPDEAVSLGLVDRIY